MRDEGKDELKAKGELGIKQSSTGNEEKAGIFGRQGFWRTRGLTRGDESDEEVDLGGGGDLDD